MDERYKNTMQEERRQGDAEMQETKCKRKEKGDGIEKEEAERDTKIQDNRQWGIIFI